MTKEEVNALALQCEKELRDLGYDIPKISYNFTYNSVSTMGLCQYNKEKDFCIIKVSKFHWENNSEQEVRNTIIHELTHAIDRNKHSHNHVWLRLAKEVSLKTNTKIEMYAHDTEGELKASMERAVAYIDCSGCNRRYFLFRRTKAYKKEGEGYACSSCGSSGSLNFVKLK